MKIVDTLKSIFSNLKAENSGSTAIEYSFASLNKLNAIVGEQRRMRALKDAHAAQAPQLKSDIAALEVQRVELLTEAIIEGSDDKSAKAESLAAQISVKQKQLSDIDQVVASIDNKIAGLNDQRDNLKMQYLRDLGTFLNGIFAEMADEYNRKATELADVALQITALRKVMLFYKTGDTGFFEERMYLPMIVPKSGNTQVPIIDFTSPVFRDGAKRFEDSIREQLREAGFNWRFD